MAAKKRKRKKKSRLKILLLFLLVPLLAWFLAFVGWLYWDDIDRLAGWSRPGAGRVQKPADEKIFEDDRKKLDDLLKKRAKRAY